VETAPATGTLSEFAARLGRSPSYVTKLKQRERLVFTADGQVDFEASIRRIAALESGQPQHAAARRAHAEKRNGEVPPAPPGPEEAAELAAPPRGSRAHWELRETMARAETRELELRKLKGELVEVGAVAAAGAEIGIAVRATLENLADQLAPVLIAEKDEPGMHRQLREALDQALRDIGARLESALQALGKEAGE